ncbi:MAG: histidine kinase [Nitriliruptoraceae bacterium]
MARDGRREREGAPTAPVWLQRPGDRLAQALSAVGLERWARLAATLLSTVLLLLSGRFEARAVLVLLLLLYVVVTGLLRRGRYVRSADLAVAAILAAFAGPDVVAFLPFLLVAVAGTATIGGAIAGLAAGGTLAIVLVAGALAFTDVQSLQAEGVLAVALLLPMTGLVAASAGQLVSDPTVRDRLVLQQANRLLSSLSALADTLPGGLDASTVSAAIVTELQRLPGVRAGAVLVREGALLRSDAVTGLPRDAAVGVPAEELEKLSHRRRILRAERDLPTALASAKDYAGYWRALPLGVARPPLAFLVAGFDEADAARAARTRLQVLAQDGGLALDNARLFDRTQLRAADAARRRIAAELHDGVAQSLAHLKLELGLLGRSEVVDHDELRRLSRVADSALVELRDTIAGLRAPSGSDVAALLGRHLEDLRSPRGPRLTLTVHEQVLLDPDRADEALRVAQEALSNALRHAHASEVELTLDTTGGTVLLTITDDGTGPQTTSDQAGGGVGLRSMRERADRLGGKLEIGASDHGGTLVALAFPAEPTLPTGSAP